MTRPLIHIGYQKTGTTWLQRFLFPAKANAGFAAVPKRLPRREFIIAHPLDFDADRSRQKVEKALAEASADGAVPVITAERLSGSPHSGHHDVKDIAQRLHATAPEGRVLAVIREQRAMINSCYRQYVTVGGSLPPEHYLAPMEGGMTRMPAFEADIFAYDRLLGLYREQFGADSVLVLPFELMLAEPRDFVGRVAAFAEAPVSDEVLDGLPFGRARNVAPIASQLALRRVLNKLGADDRVNPAPLFYGEVTAQRVRRLSREVGARLPDSVGRRFTARLERAVDEVAKGRFGASNRVLSEWCGIDLARYGYDVGGSSEIGTPTS
jgi:hypothetical protein